MARIELPTELPCQAGSVVLDPERAADEGFLRLLFDSARPLAQQLAQLPPEVRELVMQGQFQAQTRSYRAQFAQARGFIVKSQNAPIGRVLFDESGPMLHVIDLALLPAWRAQGIGTALLLALAAAAAPRGLSLAVAEENAAAQRLYERLGFAVRGRAPGYLQLARSSA